MLSYEIDIAGLKRSLPLCPISDDTYIGAFVIFGDVELTQHCARELLKRAPRCDYLIAPEAKAIPLVYEMSRQSGIKYYLARKHSKAYMSGVFEVTVHSITTEGEQKLSPDTYVSVFADVASQNLDWKGPGVPCSYSVRVVVHYANADDKSGAGFRDACAGSR